MTSIQPIQIGNPVPPPNQSKQVQPIEDFLKSFTFPLHKEEKPNLTADTAKKLIYRAMTTGVPNWEMDQYGGSLEVMKVFEANGGQYDITTIPADQRRDRRPNDGAGLPQQCYSSGLFGAGLGDGGGGRGGECHLGRAGGLEPQKTWQARCLAEGGLDVRNFLVAGGG